MVKRDVPLTIKFGTVYLTPTEWNHVYVGLSDPDNASNISIRGVGIHGNLHLYRWQDGHMHVGPEDKSTYERRHSVYLKRADWLDRPHGQGEPSESARDLLIEMVSAAVDKWVTEHPLEMQRAEVQDKERDEVRTAGKVKEVEALLETARKEYYGACEALAGAQQALRYLATTTKAAE